MRIMILAGQDSVIGMSFESGFKLNNHETCYVDYNKYINRKVYEIERLSNYLPRKYRELIRSYFLSIIQKGYISEIEAFRPELILVYNDQMVSNETISFIKESKIKLAVYLADNPFFLTRRVHIMGLLFNADQVFAADSYWLKGLNMIGIRNTNYHVPGYDNQTFNLTEKSYNRNSIVQEIVYIGSTYMNIWGYRRALFLNKFNNMNFRFYGPPKWDIWFEDFPELKNHFHVSQSRLSGAQVNHLLNNSLIYPVDANPGIINGFHFRVIESIACGVLPIVENKQDVHTVFKNVHIPVFKDYSHARELAAYYIQNEEKREALINSLINFVIENYLPVHSTNKLLNKIFN